MFDIGMSELILVALLAIMLYGGELPDVARKAGQTVRRLRGVADDLKRQITVSADPELTALVRDADPRREPPSAPPQEPPAATSPATEPAPPAPTAANEPPREEAG